MNRVALLVTLVTAFGIGCKKAEPTKPEPAKTESSTENAGSAKPDPAPAPAVAPPADDPWSKPAAAKDPLKKPFLWSIEKDGKTSYVLGTIHQGIDAESRLPAIVFEKLDAAPAFAMETDLSAASASDAMQKMIQCVGCSLKKELSKEEYAKLEKLLGAATVSKIQGMKPMVAATMVSLSFMPQTSPMDGILQGRATRLGKKMIYLEEAISAAKVLEKWMDVRALKLMLADLDDAKRQMADMLTAYVAGDDVKLLAINDEEKAKTLKVYTEAEYEQQQADMLYNRNAAWLPAIEAMHAAGGGFIAVGTLHLVGPKSVPDLLAKKGYKITRIVP